MLANIKDDLYCGIQVVYLGNSPLVVEEQEAAPVKIYPNPAEDFVSIELPFNYSPAQLSIYNLTGQLITKRQLTQINQQVPIAELGNGVYIFVTEIGDNTIERNRVIVSR